MKAGLRFFVGYDTREREAYHACVHSIRGMSSLPTRIFPISSRILGSRYSRREERRGGITYDVMSDAPMSTEFSLARFYAPLLCRSGWYVFCDCDFLFRADPAELFELIDERYAIMVVKHGEEAEQSGVKMDGQIQLPYPRKNWSSLMLVNSEHRSVRCLDQAKLDDMTGLQMHRFMWLDDEEIGSLPPEWNWLEGISSPAINPKAVHFTRGVPSMAGFENSAYADEWRKYADGYAKT